MPLLYSYKNTETDPDKLWKIKRRVAKSLREANDDNRGLAETVDMSDDVESITDKLNQIMEKTINLGSFLSSERLKLTRKTEIINIPEFNFSLIAKFLTDFNKIDVNKMNAQNIEVIQKLVDRLETQIGILTDNVATLKENVETKPLRKPAGRPKKVTGVEESKGDIESPTKTQETQTDDPLTKNQEIQIKSLIEFYKMAISTLNDLINRVQLKLSNYKQTTAVLRETGIEALEGSGMGGCCCDSRLEYSPQYQNRMFY
jgi:hypothetical protein